MPRRKAASRKQASAATDEPVQTAAVLEMDRPEPSPSAPDMPPPMAEPPGPDAARRSARGRDAVGGRLEFLGGDFGRGKVPIGLFGEDQHLGILTPDGEFIELDRQVRIVNAWPDQTEQRWISAIGWAWTFSIVGGLGAAALGGGLRLLHPKHMMFEMRLVDGRHCVGRTDAVTIEALTAIAADLA